MQTDVKSSAAGKVLLAIGIICAFLVIFNSKANPKPDFTLSDYYACKEGMTYEEVVKILGGEGKQNSLNRSDSNQTIAIYTWESSKGGYTTMSFNNNILVTKVQSNLKE